MRFLAINLGGKRYVDAIISVVLLLVILLSTAIGTVIHVYRDELFIEASGFAREKYTVIIDAGHGGEDCGAIGKNGVYEKDLNLQISMIIGELLEERGYNVVYTRTEDKLLYRESENIKGLRKISDLKNRCKVVMEYENPIFISIHMNSFGDSRYSGLQVYYSESDETSRILAQRIQDEVRNTVQNENKRTVKAGKNIYLLENIETTAVLVECGFLSNAEECEKLSDKEYQKRLSFSIVCAIIEYMDMQLD